VHPPWGPKGYDKKVFQYSISDLEVDLRELLKQAFTYSPNVMLYLPNKTQIQELTQELAYFSQVMN